MLIREKVMPVPKKFAEATAKQNPFFGKHSEPVAMSFMARKPVQDWLFGPENGKPHDAARKNNKLVPLREPYKKPHVKRSKLVPENRKESLWKLNSM